MTWKLKARRQGHPEEEETVTGGWGATIFPSASSNSQIWSLLLSLFSFNLQPNSLFHYRDNASHYLFIGGCIMMDAFQSTPALIRSARTLARSVSTLPIITHDCCDLVPTPRQLEPRLRTISYRAAEAESKGRGRKKLRKWGNGGEAAEREGGKGKWGAYWTSAPRALIAFNVIHSSRWG